MTVGVGDIYERDNIYYYLRICMFLVINVHFRNRGFHICWIIARIIRDHSGVVSCVGLCE